MKRHDINWMNKTTVTKKPPSNTATIKTTPPVRSKDTNKKGSQMITSFSSKSCTSTNIVSILYTQPPRKNSPPREHLDKPSRDKTRKESTATTQDSSTKYDSRGVKG